VPAVIGHHIRKEFPGGQRANTVALDGVSFQAEHGALTALIGPDGAGKTTLIRLIAGLLTLDGGDLRVLDLDVAVSPQQVQSQIGYMPQRFGLYEDLSVRENLDLYADLHGVSPEQRNLRYPQLYEMTGLGPFKSRLAGRLSGGMKQKLGLACTLVRSPELLLLDEPTVGVDPLSRRELWEIILHLVQKQKLTVLLSTAYLDEAERCGHVIVLREGKVLWHGPPAEVTQLAEDRVFLIQPSDQDKPRNVQTKLLDESQVVDALPFGGKVRLVTADKGHIPGGNQLADMHIRPTTPRFEDGFMVLLKRSTPRAGGIGTMQFGTPAAESGPGSAIEVSGVVRRFGNFVAVDHLNFEVRRGEIFGLLGPNGAGKTTTFRMLCGLLATTEGKLNVAGADLRRARASARQRLGYVAQKFSLYGQLSVVENLDFFASAYGLRGKVKRRRIDWAVQQFELTDQAHVAAGQLPVGFKQRLAMAAALLHQPQILFLDEPTSGADPLARREFWRRITALSQRGVTVIITTHFMEEAEYCDRVAIMDAGRILAQGTPGEIRRHAPAVSGREATMEDAFIAVVEEGRISQSAGQRASGGKA
jgi:ABC-2 type transport system ATP-binding protein